MTVTPGCFELSIYQGATFTEDLQWTDSAGVPINLTGCTAEMEARSQLTDPAAFLDLSTANGGIILTDPTNGKLQLIIAPAATANLPVGQGTYDLKIIFPSGEQDFLIQGNITVYEMNTR